MKFKVGDAVMLITRGTTPVGVFPRIRPGAVGTVEGYLGDHIAEVVYAAHGEAPTSDNLLIKIGDDPDAQTLRTEDWSTA